MFHSFYSQQRPDQEFMSVIRNIERDLSNYDGVIAGHSGIPFHKCIDGVTWFNSGAIGMPAHNGKSTTSYGILDAGSFTIHNLSYDHQTAQACHDHRRLGSWLSHRVGNGLLALGRGFADGFAPFRR
jgi:hypothetical protein